MRFYAFTFGDNCNLKDPVLGRRFCMRSARVFALE